MTERDQHRLLRAVKDETPPLSLDDLQKRGNEMLREARQATVTAIAASMPHEFFRQGKTEVSDIRRLQDEARRARKAWAKVEAIVGEFLLEVEKSREKWREGKRLTVVPDGTGRAGHYKTEWVDKEDYR